MIDRLQHATFDRRMFKLHPASRFVIRVVSYSFLIFCIGLAAAFLVSDIVQLNWLGALLVLMLVDYMVHVRRPHYSLTDFGRGRVRNNNIALCLDRASLKALLSAYESAITRGVDMEFALLLRLSDERVVQRSLQRLEVKPSEFKDRISADIDKTVHKDPQPVAEAYIERIRLLCISAAAHAAAHGQDAVGVGNLFSALAHTTHPRILRLLDYYSLSDADVDAALVFGSHTSSRTAPYLGGFAMRHAQTRAHRVNRSFTSRPTPTLDMYATDVTDYVRDGYGGFLIGHEEEYDRMVDVLSRPGERNVLLVGESGVGKEALVYHLAHRIVTDAVPGALYDRRVVELSLADMLSGTSGEDSTGRLKQIAEEILRAGNILLYIPDAHLLEKSAAQGTLSLADVFMPILKSGTFPVVAATYPKEFRQFIESRPAFADSFEVLRIQELSQSDAIRLPSYSALILEKKYRITISTAAVTRAVGLAAKYIRTKPLPSSAQELLQETAVDAAQRGEKLIRSEHVTAVVERTLHMPVRVASGMEAKELLKLEDTIHTSYIDQDEAVVAVARALRTYRSGLGRKGGPISSFLFIGPTGVGKTELSKILAKLYFGAESFLIRFDMSEYQEKQAVARFIGSSDGKTAGQLTEAVSHQPYSVVLLDEFEKAHPDILNLFLQVLDEGRLTDSTGRTVDFTHTIIIATSNAHSVLVQQHVQKHGSIEGLTDELKQRLSEYFRPELTNRFSDIIIFKPLSREDLTQIVSLQAVSLSRQVSEAQGIKLTISASAQEKPAHLGYDPAFGARPLRQGPA